MYYLISASRESSVSVQKGVADSSSLADDIAAQEDVKPSTSDVVTTVCYCVIFIVCLLFRQLQYN